MQAIDEAMRVIEKTIQELGSARDEFAKEERAVIRRELEKVAKAARWEALNAAVKQVEMNARRRDAFIASAMRVEQPSAALRRMAEEAT